MILKSPKERGNNAENCFLYAMAAAARPLGQSFLLCALQIQTPRNRRSVCFEVALHGTRSTRLKRVTELDTTRRSSLGDLGDSCKPILSQA